MQKWSGAKKVPSYALQCAHLKWKRNDNLCVSLCIAYQTQVKNWRNKNATHQEASMVLFTMFVCTRVSSSVWFCGFTLFFHSMTHNHPSCFINRLRETTKKTKMENLHDAYITRETVCVCLHDIVLLCANFKHSNLIILGWCCFVLAFGWNWQCGAHSNNLSETRCGNHNNN